MQRKAGHVAGRVVRTVLQAVVRESLQREYLAAAVRADRDMVGDGMADQFSAEPNRWISVTAPVRTVCCV